MVEFLLDAPVTLIQGVASKVHDVEGVSMTALAPGSSSAAALLNPVNPSIATISMRSRQVWGLGGQPGFEDPLGAARDHVQEPGGRDGLVRE